MRGETLLRQAVKVGLLVPGLGGRRRPGDLIVLLYHTIGLRLSEIDVPPAAFRRHLALLAERERVRPLDDAVSGREEGGVVVTFDDGYRDFNDRVVPLLVEHRVPAVLYLATGLVDGARNGEALSWSQLREAVATGLVTVGSHTHSHLDLSRASEAEAEEEMRRSKELIEDRLGVPCRHFAYPFAIGSPAADRVVRRLFSTAALDAWRTNRRGGLDPHRLGRTPVLRSDGQLFFRAKVRGLLDTEALAYRALRRGPWRSER